MALVFRDWAVRRTGKLEKECIAVSSAFRGWKGHHFPLLHRKMRSLGLLSTNVTFNLWGKLDRIPVPLHADHNRTRRDTPVKTIDLAEHLHGDNMVLCIFNKAHSRTVKTEQNFVARCQRVSVARFAKVGTPTPMRNGIDVAQGLGASGAVEGESVVLLLEQSLCAALIS
uniref:WGS project CAEQ00000000 data, annotated contig 1731 n=1 Tax=Trypanosoma congolense (strain IL3000) TaxID=1068625 RepID=F9W8E6_TRYCI|nr:unnamed protein product [Trypanosoma congolense IL3000]